MHDIATNYNKDMLRSTQEHNRHVRRQQNAIWNSGGTQRSMQGLFKASYPRPMGRETRTHERDERKSGTNSTMMSTTSSRIVSARSMLSSSCSSVISCAFMDRTHTHTHTHTPTHASRERERERERENANVSVRVCGRLCDLDIEQAFTHKLRKYCRPQWCFMCG